MRHVDIDLSNEGLNAKVRRTAAQPQQQPLRDIPQPTHPMRADLGLATWMLTVLTIVAGVGGIAFWLVGSVTGLHGISAIGVLLLLACVVLAVFAWLAAGGGE